MAKAMDMKAKPPVLLTIYGDQREKQSLYSVLENQFHHTSIPILCKKSVLASTFGWLVLVDHWKDECCLWNPTSMHIIMLPKLDSACTFTACILTKPPTQFDCHILFNSTTTGRLSYCRIGDNELVTQYVKEKHNASILSTVASFKGKIYGLVEPGNEFVTVDFVGGSLELNPIMLEGGQPWSIHIPSRSWSHCTYSHLIESYDGELLLVRKMYATYCLEDFCDFKIFRVDTNRMECTELETIGNRAIFLFFGGGFCCSSQGIKPNSIYYTDFETKNLYMFDLDDRSTTVLLLRCPGEMYMRQTSWIDQQILHNLINFS